jgi:hypothetical protein
VQQAVIHRIVVGVPIGSNSSNSRNNSNNNYNNNNNNNNTINNNDNDNTPNVNDPPGSSVLEQFFISRCSASMHFALRCYLLLRAAVHEPGSSHVNNDEDESLDVLLQRLLLLLL